MTSTSFFVITLVLLCHCVTLASSHASRSRSLLAAASSSHAEDLEDFGFTVDLSSSSSSSSSSPVGEYTSRQYACDVCRHIAGDILKGVVTTSKEKAKGEANTQAWRDLKEECHNHGQEGCDFVNKRAPTLAEKLQKLASTKQEQLEGVHALCVFLHVCPETANQKSLSSSSSATETSPPPPDVRVARGHAKRGYYAMRVSLVAEDNDTTLPPLTTTAAQNDVYDEKFRYRWTHLRLRSELIHAQPGWNAINVQAPPAKFYLPASGEGTVGLWIADPCVSSEFVPCTWGDKYQTATRIPGLVNAATAFTNPNDGTPDVSFWGILGDNFYDRYGHITTNLFSKLSMSTKLTTLVAAPGNHDYWAYGSPTVCVATDQFGNGFMQYYAQDAEASLDSATNGTAPFNFSVNPDTGKEAPRWWPKWLPDPWDLTQRCLARESHSSNFQSYYAIGDMGVISYSSAYTYDEQSNFLADACDYFVGNDDVNTVMIVGHWSDENDGCAENMHVPGVFDQMRSKIGSCAKLDSAKKFIFFQGHDHCNIVIRNSTGFQVAGEGMAGCDDRQNFGITVIDTKSKPGAVRVIYVNVMTPFGLDRYDEVTSCFAKEGVVACADKYGEVWLDSSSSPSSSSLSSPSSTPSSSTEEY